MARSNADNAPRPLLLTPAVLRHAPLPAPDAGGDKEEKGRVLIVGGAREMPGAPLLSATAALRAGAGKLQIATVGSVAVALGVAVPEARVVGLPETRGGVIAPSAAEQIAALAEGADAVLVGPGMADEAAIAGLMDDLLPMLSRPTLILDAAPLAYLAQSPHALHGREGGTVLTPHGGEMAALLEQEKDGVTSDPEAAAREAADRFHAVVAFKGAETFIASPEGGALYRNRAGNIGLAVSGSGDVLAGLVAGLAARGADALTAALWGVALHARAGDRLAGKLARLGYLPRELLHEVPPLMAELERGSA